MDINLEGFWIPEFRTLEDEFVAVPTPSDPRRVNVLLGRNGSGKSSLLEALRLLGDHQAEEGWDSAAVAAYRVGAHFTGLETWRGTPRSQLDGLLHSLPNDDKFNVSVEDYTVGDPLASPFMREQDDSGDWRPTETALKELEDPAPEQRQGFTDRFAQLLQDRPEDPDGKNRKAGPFTLEQWLVAIAAVDPQFLQLDLQLDKIDQQIADQLGDFENPQGRYWSRDPGPSSTSTFGGRWRRQLRRRYGNGFELSTDDVQRRFLHTANTWVDTAATAFGPEIAATLIGSFLTRPLVLVGNGRIEGSPGFPAFFGLGLLREDLDSEVANALEALAGQTGQQGNRLVDGLVSAWKDNSPIIRIAHPELSNEPPIDFAEISHPLHWSISHAWGGEAIDEFSMTDFHEGGWEVDLAPATLIPDVIAATPKPGQLLEYLENQLPALHDRVYCRDQKYVPPTPITYVGGIPTPGWGNCLSKAGYFDPMRPADVRYPGPAVANGWCVSVVPPSGPNAEGGPTGLDGGSPLLVRGSVRSIATMISQRANQLAPGFLRQEGWIAVQVTSPADWFEGKPRLGVRLVRSVDADNRAEHATRLEHLSDGLARWVSLVVRLAVTDLKASSWMTLQGDRKAEVDAAVDASNLIGGGGQITAKEFTPDLGEVRELVPGFTVPLGYPGEDWFKFAAMQEPRRLLESVDDQAWKNTLILIDEPEVHLHLDAQRSVRDWIGDIAAGNYRAVDPLWTENRSDTTRLAIVASHSTIFLDYPPETTRTTLVYAETAVEPREPTSLDGFDETTDPEHDNIPVTDGTQQIRTALTPVPEGRDLFQFFKGEQGKRLGTSGIDVISLYSGFIIVEGLHDELVLERFYGTDLRNRRIGLLRAWGTKNAEAADLLTYIGKPVAILVDRAKLGPTEKAAVKAFVQSCVSRKLPHWPDHGQAGGHPYPDIIAALPDDAVRDAFPNSTFNGWDPIVDEFEQMRGQGTTTGNFKDFATRKMGLDMPTKGFYPQFIKPVLKQCGDETRPREGLELVMNEIISFMANPKADIGSDDIDDEPF